MSESFSVECPSCFVSFKLKDRKLIGKKVRCPKCKEPMTVADAAAAADEWSLPTVDESADPPASRGLPPRTGQAKPTPTTSSAESDKPKKKRKARSEETSAAVIVGLWILGGAIGGGLGAMAWAFIVRSTDYEIGYAAWLVGALAGGGVRILSMGHEGAGPGVTAGILGLCAILFGKYLVFAKDVGDARMWATAHENFLISEIAYEVIAEKYERGEEIEMNGMDWEDYAEEFSGIYLDDYGPEDVPKEFPPEIWQEATNRWNAKSAEEREQAKQTYEDERSALVAYADSWYNFAFSMFDLIWIPLAVATAYSIGGRIELGDD